MCRFLLSVVFLSFLSGCCSNFCTDSCGWDHCHAPPLNYRGTTYDGSSSPCYNPPGPFWTWHRGPGLKCNDPYLCECDPCNVPKCRCRREVAPVP